MKQDVPPPSGAVTRHALFPTPGHDEAARWNFLAKFNTHMALPCSLVG